MKEVQEAGMSCRCDSPDDLVRIQLVELLLSVHFLQVDEAALA